MEEDVKYPIGHPTIPQDITMEHIRNWILEMENAPTLLMDAVRGLTPEQLDTPYRPEGWTVRQVVHHLADTHVNTYITFRRTLTEERPSIPGHDVNGWAELMDAKTGDIGASLALFDSLQERFANLLWTMDEVDFRRKYRRTDGSERDLATTLGIYAWHGRHHAAHITHLKEKMEW